MIMQRSALLIIACILLPSCVSVKDYPRCFLFRSPQPGDVAEADRSARLLFDQTLHVRRYSLSKDWVSVKADLHTQMGVRTVWPEIGCVNLRREPPFTGEIHDKWIVARCQEYLEQMVAREKSQPPDSRSAIADRFKEFTCH
jgi:hypothetical protein